MMQELVCLWRIWGDKSFMNRVVNTATLIPFPVSKGTLALTNNDRSDPFSCSNLHYILGYGS